MVSFYESLEVKLNGLGIFLDSERILMHIAIALAPGEFKGLVVRERDPSRCASLNLRCCSVRDSSRFSVLASTAIPFLRPRNRERLAWSAGGGNEHPCSPAGCRRNPLRTISPPTDPHRLLRYFLVSPFGLAAVPQEQQWLAASWWVQLHAGTTFYPCPTRSLIEHLMLCSSTDDSKPELRGASPSYSRRPVGVRKPVGHSLQPCLPLIRYPDLTKPRSHPGAGGQPPI